MATISMILDTRNPDQKGNYPVKLRILHNQSSAYVSLNCFLPEKAWILNGVERPVKTSHPGAKVINDRIESLYIEIRKRILDFKLSGWLKNVKAVDIKKRILADRAVESDEPDMQKNFMYFANQFANEGKAAKTKESYLNTIKKIKIFNGKEGIEFEEINYQFLRKFDEWLAKSGSGVNTRSIHFRNIRTVFNRAIDDEVIPNDMYPFRKFKIKTQEKEKESLTAVQVKKLYEYELKTPTLRMARDYWMLSFFLCGINPIDLFNLKRPANGDGRISFVRSKMQGGSHDTIRLLLQPEAQEIINRYQNEKDSPYLLIFIDKYVSYDIFIHFLAKKIREVAKITGLNDLTLYWARYSWATIADNLDIAEKTISKGLGHVDKSMAGRKYISYDWSKVDKANRQVIDFVLDKSNNKQLTKKSK